MTQPAPIRRLFDAVPAAGRESADPMRRMVSYGIALSLLMGLYAAVNAKDDAANNRVLRHVVLFKFKESADDSKVRQVVEAFAALPSKIDVITDFEHGTDVSVENKSKGFTHGFVVSFRDEEGRDEYLPHPAHKEFVSLVGPVLEDVLVFDYYAEQ